MAQSTPSQNFLRRFKNAALLVLFVSSLFVDITKGRCIGCGDGQTCCENVCIYGSNCLGYYCSSALDCATGENCCNSACVNGTSCLGQTCSSDSDCGFNEGPCCSSICTSGYDCVGEPCTTNADCGRYEYCCGDTCTFVDCSADDVMWVILGSTFGTVFVILAVSLCVGFSYRRRRPAYGRVIEGQRVIIATTVTETNPPYHGQALPSYQEGYPYYPPPQYVQYPPYNVGSTKSSEPPPPYSGAPEGRSVGVAATQNNYGAVQNSNLPV